MGQVSITASMTRSEGQRREALINEGWKNLANGIVLQAARDYRRTLRRQGLNPEKETVSEYQLSIEQFFRSDWFKTICNLDGEALMLRIRAEVMDKRGQA